MPAAGDFFPASSAAGLSANPTAESPSRSSSRRASGLLQNKYLIYQYKRNRQVIYHQELHSLGILFQDEFLQLDNLRDPAQPRSTLPLRRTTPARLSRRSRSRYGRAHNRAHCLPLGRRRRPKKKKRHKKQMQDFRKVPVCTHLSLLPAEAALRF